jgi:hypothetical protein
MVQLLRQQAGAYRLAIVTFAVGLFIGLVVLGWWLWPVEWTNAGFAHLGPDEQEAIVEAASDLNAFDLLSPRVAQLMRGWDGDVMACQLAEETADVTEYIRLVALAYRVNGTGCP